MSTWNAVRVDVCGVTASTQAVTADNCEWIITGVEGWDAPSQRGSQSPPTGIAGTNLSGSLHGGRQVIARGAVFASTPADLWAAYYRVAGAMPGLGLYGDLIVYEDVVKTLRVTQGAPPLISEPAQGCFTFELTLLAEYPFKRAVDAVDITIAAGDSETFTAAGNFAAEITVTSLEIGSMSLDAYGARLATSVSLPAGSVMDSLTRTIVNDIGENRYQFIQRNSQWLAVQPGSNTFANSGTADVVLSYYPTYA